MLAETVDAVIGIDTHRDTHEAVIADPSGRPIAAMRIGNDSAGFARLLAAIAKTVPGPRVAVSVEGTRSYGIGLARALAAAGLLVIECERPSRKRRRGKGKSDPIDAHLAVLAALRLDVGKLPVPRADGDREALRILLVARQEIRVTRTAQAGRLRALLLAGDDTGRRTARKALTGKALAALAGGELPAGASHEQAVRQAEIRRLALAICQGRRQLKDNHAQLLAIVEDIAPGLTSRHGVGPVSAAQAIVSFSHPGRCRSEAAFAALGGTSPIPASSGQTIRHRLNRGGDRALNRASCAIAVTRMRSCPRTRAYVARRTAEGKTTREIRRCLKRYIARELYRQLTRSMNPPRAPLTNIEASGAVLFQYPDGAGVDADSPRRAALGRALGPLAADDGRRAGDPDFRLVQVDVIPAQVEQLAPPGAGVGGEAVEGRQPVTARQLQKDSELGRCPHLAEFAARAPGALRPFCRVGREHLVHDHRVLEGLAQDLMHIVHGPG